MAGAGQSDAFFILPTKSQMVNKEMCDQVASVSRWRMGMSCEEIKQAEGRMGGKPSLGGELDKKLRPKTWGRVFRWGSVQL